MGLLALGTPLQWDEAKKHADHVRMHGIQQFLHIWERLKDRVGDALLWGDEVRSVVLSVCVFTEHKPFYSGNRSSTWSFRSTTKTEMLVFHSDSRRFWASLISRRSKPSDRLMRLGMSTKQECLLPEILFLLKNDLPESLKDRLPTFHPEYGRYMLESTPGAPYGASLKDLLGVESNMRLR
jgi:glutamate--cysteine ligase catalytic subunit